MTESLHASCVARGGSAVLLSGPPGVGKSDLALRLIDRGFVLVADDQVIVENGRASAPPALAGLIEVRGLGLLRLPFEQGARLRLSVRLGAAVERLPAPGLGALGLPEIIVEAWAASAPLIVARALDCLEGKATLAAGALA